MQKRIKITFLFILSLLILGCEDNSSQNDYSNYKHYDLKDKMNINKYNYEGNTYILADISDNKTIGYNGLFYKVGKDDYILIEKIESNPGYVAEDFISEKNSLFFENKLYIIRNLGVTLREYTLNNEKVYKRDLNFNMDNVYDKDKEKLFIDYIEKVNQEYIFYRATIKKDNDQDIIIKCSLNELLCDIDRIL